MIPVVSVIRFSLKIGIRVYIYIKVYLRDEVRGHLYKNPLYFQSSYYGYPWIMGTY